MFLRSIPFILGDLAALWLSVPAAYLIRFRSGWIPLLEDQPVFLYLNSLLLVTPLYVFILNAMGNYQERHGKISQYEVQNLFRSLTFFYVVCLAITFLMKTAEHSRTTIAIAFILNLLLCWFFRKILVHGQITHWKRGLNLVRVLILGRNRNLIAELARHLENNPQTGYRIVDIKSIDEERSVDPEQVDRVLLAGDLTFGEIADCVLTTPQQIRVDLIPSYHLFLRNLPFKEQLGTFTLLPLNQQVFSDWNSATKRMMDIAISTFVLLVLSPLLLLISILIYLTYGKPILYRQERVGQNGRLFTLYKFRTMKPGADKDVSELIATQKQTIFKQQNDPRVENSFAWFLRKTGMDELPQLWNVLQGSMSLVGPRPATLELVRNYSAEHKLRLAVPPGITGLQQVYSRGSDSMEEILKYDFRYLSEQSLWLDLFILFKTFQTLLSGKGVS